MKKRYENENPALAQNECYGKQWVANKMKSYNVNIYCGLQETFTIKNKTHLNLKML
jgi:hypothetical protein